jgi:hypothetical protein
MAEEVVSGVDDSQQIVPVSDLNSVGTYLNFICLKSQLDNVILELKSLQTITALLQKETGQNYTDLVQVRCSNIAAERLSKKHDSVNSTSVNDTVLINNSSRKFDVLPGSILNDGNVILEVMDINSTSNHQSSGDISSIITVPLSKSQAHMSKSIKQTKSAVKWSDIVIGRKDNCCVPNGVLARSIPTIINGQVSSPVYNGDKCIDVDLVINPHKSGNHDKNCKILLLSDSDSDNDVVPIKKSVYVNGVNVQDTQSKIKSGCQKHRIVTLGDSHSRGCASKVKDYLNKNFEVIWFVKPGSANGTLTSSVKGTSEKFTKNDVIVFWDGTNDISKNNTKEGLKHVLSFVMNNKHTNIILISALHRHDLVEW